MDDKLRKINAVVDKFFAKANKRNEPLEAFRDTDSFTQLEDKLTTGLQNQLKWVSKNVDQIPIFDMVDPTAHKLDAAIGTWLVRNMPHLGTYIAEEKVYIYLHNAFVFSIEAQLARYGVVVKATTSTFVRAPTPRPSHQVLLEDAHNAGDYQKVKELLNAMPDDDPYKPAMQSVFAEDVKLADAAAAAAKSPAIQAVKFELTNPHYIASLKNQANYMLSLKSKIDETTRQQLITLVRDAKLQNATIDEISQLILDKSVVNSPVRAFMIANTETNQAMSSAHQAFMVENNVPTKLWIPAGPSTCPVCEANADDGEIPVDANFSSGDPHPPAHPNCECYPEAGEIDLESIDLWNGA